MKLTGARVVAFSVMWALLVLLISGFRLLRWAGREVEARGNFIEFFTIPTWWWVLLLGPPLAVGGVWIWRRAREE